MAQPDVAAMTGLFPGWYISLWRIGGLLLFLSAMMVILYLPVGVTSHPVIAGNLLYVLGMGIGSIILLYGLLNDKKYTIYIMAFINGFIVEPVFIYFRLGPSFKYSLLVTFSAMLLMIAGSLLFLWIKNAKILLPAVAGVCLGVLFFGLQFAEPSSTRPLQILLPEMRTDFDEKELSSLPIARDGWLSLHDGGYMIDMQPILRFRDHNFHGFWSIVGNQRYPDLRCMGLSSSMDNTQAFFEDSLGKYVIKRDQRNGVHNIQAWSYLPIAVNSHLNHCLVISIIGHHSLSLSVSSNPRSHVPIRAQEPLIFATLGAEGELEFLRCADREKGPFTKVSTSQPSMKQEYITLYDNDVAICKFDIMDWLLQSSISYSPTAGYGVTQNAMEVLVNGKNDSSPVMLWFSFAATSVGRGFQCVGHKAGVYRMQLKFEWLVH